MSEINDTQHTQITFDPLEQTTCDFCGCQMDVSELSPFTTAICPGCGKEINVPAKLANFKLVELLGIGGMGGVYRAIDEGLNREVAIKVMLKEYGENVEFLENFKREAQAAAKLNHPNIAQIYSFGQAQGQPYIVMELVRGAHFDQMISGSPTPLDQGFVVKICADIAEGLKMAADAELIHGDIKPENILLDERDNAKLVDFGIAAKPNTASDEIWGTPYYIAPERVLRQKIDFRSDIYCLGGTMFHALTQQPPFEGTDAIEVVKARLTAPAPDMRTLRADLNPELCEIVARMLQKEPALRYPNYNSLLGDMRKFLQKNPPTIGSGTSTRSGKKIVIKGKRKGGTINGSAPTVTATTDVGGATKKGTITISRRSGKIVTSGLNTGRLSSMNTGTLSGVKPEESAASENAEGAGSKNIFRNCLIAAIATLILVGGGGGTLAWYFFLHKPAVKAAQEAAEIAAAKEAHQKLVNTIVHNAEQAEVAEKNVRHFSDQAYAFVTQSVAWVEAELGNEYTGRILREELPDYDAFEAAAAAKVADPFDEPPTSDDAASTNEVAQVAETSSEAAENNGEENAAEENAAEGEDAEDVAAEEPEIEEPLPEFAQLARDVFEAAAPLRIAAHKAQWLKGKLNAIAASIDSAENFELPEDAAPKSTEYFDEIKVLAVNLQSDLTKTKAAFEKISKSAKELQLARERREAQEKAEAEARAKAAAEEAERQAEEAALQGELAIIQGVVTEQYDNLQKHKYREALRALSKVEPQITRAKAKQAYAIAQKRMEALQGLRDFLIASIKAEPFVNSQAGWSITDANDRNITLVKRGGPSTGTIIKWEHVGMNQIVPMIVQYIMDEPHAKKLKLRERHEQYVNAAVYCVTFGGESEAAKRMAKNLVDKANSDMKSAKKEVDEILPELVKGEDDFSLEF